ncbi:MAG: 16S rRNA (guanine(966)-N(2))-methyltransferase RsmD [Rheinheimera sp.]|uniref:16S rRNA (guanine(966)-N(2))-methyltransferase RsmD n=1 Tax=Arsukibacterium sp. UBA3155 TaxID=1946058 RepID=UPI000C8BE192|nr:16S rRNA (guanine(966)-N(2))-methyltransferase RsmD [Arsukibacterium sp. UBA3155]MAD75797.1 16S rRNA (guanine(966)-N(2))-methyltransferase RsmD [Rheinheimera sp.]|tara:strand:+ start:23622 stop:24215 length:594 start_codon:yes stop_codon:yes gene_type:complete
MKQAKTAKSKVGQPGFVRIISGQWRGRRLPVADVTGLRPTTDRVKETLFNWLMHDITASMVLDCFSGSGALAFEALSRYAAFATLIEKDSAQAKRLQGLLASLNASQAEVINNDCLRFLTQPASRQYQIVLVDPPFRQNLAIPCCQLLQQQGWLSANALIYLETEKELSMTDIPANWQLLKEKIAGQLAYRLWVKTS